MLLRQRVRGAAFGDWRCFLALLWSPTAPDVGLFADRRYHYELWHREVQLDRAIGFVGWAVLFLAGVCYQLGCFRRRGARTCVEVAAPGADSDSLAAPLMAPASP
ncbi:unnamed protein product [Prorocentrum cordatum]|uniref:Uncharacterized protein n=1 Tax=Prorocentrum cordatum TaxID=2364126 RepID=A0ABN9QJ55_9DINO|nr:unnamed protein product [Polarella glacialis]